VDTTGAKVCAWVGLAMSVVYTMYEIFWVLDSPMALAMVWQGVAMILVALSVVLLTTRMP